MAQVVVAAQAAVVKSALKLEDILKAKKYRPEALILMGGEDGKEPIFGIGVADGPGNINSVGAEFSATPAADGKAVITLIIGEEVDDVKKFIADKVGRALMLLNKLEEQIPAAIENIDAEMDAIMDAIIVVG